MKRKSSQSQKRPFIIIISLIVLNILLLFGTDAWVRASNQKQRSASFSDAEISDGQMIFKDFIIEIKARGGDSDTWLKEPILDEEGNELHGPSVGTIYSFGLTNTSNTTLTGWTMEVVSPELMWLNNAWNGKVEVFQKRDVGTISQMIDFTNYSSEVIALDYYTDHTGPMITLNPGDKILYHPSEDFKEDTLEPYKENVETQNSTAPGIIFYIPNQTLDYETTFSDGTLHYQMHISIWNVPVFIIFLFTLVVLVIFLLAFIVSYVRVKKFIDQQAHDAKIIEQSISTFVNFIDAKDANTKGHSERVAKYSYLLAKEMGFSDVECNRIYYIGLMHDCGKISIPFTILQKPAKLTDEEYEQIKKHTVYGDRMLRDFTSIEGINLGALYHHERYDGKGYPEGLAGEEIPLIARIIGVADALDAMNSNRLYRKRLEREVILRELTENKGKQFDPFVIDCVLKLINENVINLSS